MNRVAAIITTGTKLGRLVSEKRASESRACGGVHGCGCVRARRHARMHTRMYLIGACLTSLEVFSRIRPIIYLLSELSLSAI